MQLALECDKDTYISNRVISGETKYNANVGNAGTLDLYKLYNYSSTNGTPNTELTRILLHFDLQTISDYVNNNKINLNNFTASIKLFDVYGGQPTPSNFTVISYPLSKSFDEGIGKDIINYSDYSAANYITASGYNDTWYQQGCSLGGYQNCDYITASNGISFLNQYNFVTGEEDLLLDVSNVVSGVLTGLLPDSGFRISFTNAVETNSKSYFVKRFASRSAYDVSKRPKLLISFNDALQDDTLNLLFDTNNTLFFYNYDREYNLSNIIVNTNDYLTGDSCIALTLSTPISGGLYNAYFTGSQYSLGNNIYKDGLYSASVVLNSNNSVYSTKLFQSGCVKFTPIWGTINGAQGFYTGSEITFYPRKSTTNRLEKTHYSVNVYNVNASYNTTDKIEFRVNIFDSTNPTIFASRKPIEDPGTVIRQAYYSLSDATTGEIIVPYDTNGNSTLLSSDQSGMYFNFDMSVCSPGKAYVFNILLKTGNTNSYYNNASTIFNIL